MDVSNIGNIKSTAGVINHVVKAINESIVGSNETLSKSPTSFLNLQLDTIGALTSANFFEMLICKREAVKSTAMSKRSLVRYLNSEEFTGILGSPATYAFALGFKLSDLLLYSVNVNAGDNNLKIVTINRNSTISIMTYPDFTMDYYIDIYSKYTGADTSDPLNYSNPNNFTYYAQYRSITGTVAPVLSNPFVKSFIKVIGSVQYFMINIPVKQYARATSEFQSLMVNTMKYEYDIPYIDNLYGFEVFYRDTDNSDYYVIDGRPDGVTNKDGYNFSIKNRNNGQNSITFKFHRDPNNFSPVNGSSVKIVVYTTKGTGGNFTIPNWDKDLPPINNINFNQDRNIGAEGALLSMTPAITIVGGTSSGGSNELPLEDLRSLVISKSNAKNITIPELEDLAIKQGLMLRKERSDILDIYFKLIGYIESNGNEISTIPGFVNLDISKGKIPFSSSIDGYMLTPNTFFELESNAKRFTNNVNVSAMIDYIKAYNNKSNKDNDYFFPYFMRIILGSFVDAQVYDQVINSSYPTVFEYYNEGSPSIAGVNSVSIFRDPTLETSTIDLPTGDRIYNGKYSITFDLQVNSLMYANIRNYILGNSTTDSDVRIYIGLTGASTSYFVADDKVSTSLYPDGSENAKNYIVKVSIQLDTDSSVDAYERLHIVNNSVITNPRPLSNLPDESCFIDRTFDMKVFVSFRGTTKSNIISYNNVLTANDMSNPNGPFVDISAVYNIEGIVLFKNITDIIKPTVDIKLDQANLYKTYQTNVQAVYTSTVIAKDADGKEIFDTVQIVSGGNIIDTQVPRIQSDFYGNPCRVGELVVDSVGNPVYSHLIGDIIRDSSGNPELNPDGGSTIVCEIVDLPLVDRIYFGETGYTLVKEAFDNLTSRITSLTVYAPTGTSAKLGVFDTVGGGGYYFIDKTMNDAPTPLDRMALNISIGAKLDSNVDSTTATNLIITEILSYIRNNTTKQSISFAEMLEDVKANIVGIKYLELYRINDYAVGACQSIYLPTGIINEGVITVKSIVDYSNSDIVNNKLVFKPDVDVTIIQ